MKAGRNTVYDPEATNFAKSVFALVDSPAQKCSRPVSTRNTEKMDEKFAARFGKTPEQLRESISRVLRKANEERHRSIVRILAEIAARGDAEAARFFLKLGKLIAKGEHRKPHPDLLLFHASQYVDANPAVNATEFLAYLYRQGIDVSDRTARRVLSEKFGVKLRPGKPQSGNSENPAG